MSCWFKSSGKTRLSVRLERGLVTLFFPAQRYKVHFLPSEETARSEICKGWVFLINNSCRILTEGYPRVKQLWAAAQWPHCPAAPPQPYRQVAPQAQHGNRGAQCRKQPFC